MPKTKLLALTLLCVASINTQQASAETTSANQTSLNKTSTKPTSTSKATLVQTSAKQASSNKLSSTQTSAKPTGSNQLSPTQTSAKQTSTNKPGTSTVKPTTGTAPATARTSTSSSLAATNLKSTPSNQTIARLEESTANTAVSLLKEKQAVTAIPREMTGPYTPKLIDVTDQTIRLGGGKKEELMFGFAAGDKIVFNFQEENSKDLKEIEIIEYPTLSRFSDYKTSRVKNKEIIVSQQGVFIFRLRNSSLSKRICKLRIQRVPASAETERFNSSVSWINKQDTIWQSYTTDVVIGYDTSYIPRTKRVMVRSEIEEQLISDEIQKINPQQKVENRTSVVVSLPINNRGPYKTTRVVSWAYWLGVGPEASRAWQQNLRTVRTQNMDYYTPLGAYANNTLTSLTLPKTGQQVNYFIADQANRDLFMQKQPFSYIDDGRGFGGYRKFTTDDQCQGSYYLCFENLNLLGYTDVTIKVIALVEKSYFEDQAYEEQVITPVTEKQIKQQPFIKNTNLPVTGM
jgi:hypothetical protein